MSSGPKDQSKEVQDIFPREEKGQILPSPMPTCNVFYDRFSPISWKLVSYFLEASKGKLEVTHLWDASTRSSQSSVMTMLKRCFFRAWSGRRGWCSAGWKGEFRIARGPWLKVNGPVESVMDRMGSDKTDVAILLGFPYIFDSASLQCYKRIINYHNSFLPEYRGLNSTGWSLVDGKTLCGFSFHEVDQGIDTGPILYQERFELKLNMNAEENEVLKTMQACSSMGRIVDQIVKGTKGVAQKGKKKLYTHKEWDQLLWFDRGLSPKEKERLIKLFGHLRKYDRGRWVRVTDIDDEGNATRYDFLPIKLHRLLRPLMSKQEND